MICDDVNLRLVCPDVNRLVRVQVREVFRRRTRRRGGRAGRVLSRPSRARGGEVNQCRLQNRSFRSTARAGTALPLAVSVRQSSHVALNPPASDSGGTQLVIMSKNRLGIATATEAPTSTRAKAFAAGMLKDRGHAGQQREQKQRKKLDRARRKKFAGTYASAPSVSRLPPSEPRYERRVEEQSAAMRDRCAAKYPSASASRAGGSRASRSLSALAATAPGTRHYDASAGSAPRCGTSRLLVAIRQA